MLNSTNAIATIGVKNLEAARKFYGEKLGLKALDSAYEEMTQLYSSGNVTISVYESEFAGTNRATALSWEVGEKLRDEVRTLKEKGIEFEHYDMPEAKMDGDIHVMGDVEAAWFKDPDGNILCLSNTH